MGLSPAMAGMPMSHQDPLTFMCLLCSNAILAYLFSSRNWRYSLKDSHTALQSQNAVSACFSGEPILPIGFAG